MSMWVERKFVCEKFGCFQVENEDKHGKSKFLYTQFLLEMRIFPRREVNVPSLIKMKLPTREVGTKVALKSEKI